jgi:adenylate cyclase
MTQSEAAILVVDDNEDNRYTLTRRLRRQGYENVAVATNGREALNLIGRRPFDLILLDIMMPEMDGFEFLAELRKDRALHDIPVIVLTAAELSEDSHRRLNGGVERVLQKAALNREELLAELRQLVLRYLPAGAEGGAFDDQDIVRRGQRG